MLPDAVIWRTSLILLPSKFKVVVAVWLPKSSPPATAAAREDDTFENPGIDKMPCIFTAPDDVIWLNTTLLEVTANEAVEEFITKLSELDSKPEGKPEILLNET